MRAGTDLVRQQIPTRVSVNTVFHSALLSVDQGLNGTARFAVSMNSGGHGSLRSVTSALLAELAGANQNTIVIQDAISGVATGCVLRIGNAEHVTVSSVLVETTVTNVTTTTITTTEVLESPYAANTPVVFVAFPVTVVQSVPSLRKVLVDSPSPLVPGDRITSVATHGLVTVVTDIAMVASATMVFVMSATSTRWLLETTADISTEQGASIYVRADTAYVSTEIPLPSLSGPYVIDVAGGKTFGTGDDGLVISATFSGSSTVSYTGPRNSVVVSPPVRAGDVACWKFERGTALLAGLDDVFLTPDTTGRLGFGVDLPVHAPVNFDWVVSSPSPLRLVFETDTGTVMSDVPSGVDTSVVHTITGSYVIIRAVSAPGQAIHIRSNPLTAGFSTVTYAYHVSVSGSDVWAGTGLLLKPLILQCRDMLAIDDEQEVMTITSGGLIL